MKKLILFLCLATCSITLFSMRQTLQERYQNIFEQREQRRNAGASEQELEQLEDQLDELLQRISQNNATQNTPVTQDMIQQEFILFKTWAEKTHVCDGGQQVRDFEVLIQGAQEDSDEHQVRRAALYTVLIGIKQARLKLELLSVGSFFSKNKHALVAIPLSDDEKKCITKHVIQILFDMLHTNFENSRRLKKLKNKAWVHAYVVKTIVSTLPRHLRLSWPTKVIRGWKYRARRMLTAMWLYAPGRKKAHFYDILSYDLYNNNKKLCDDIVKAFDTFYTCDNQYRQCSQELGTIILRLERRRKNLAKTMNKNIDDAFSHSALTVLRLRLSAMQESLDEHGKPGFKKVSSDAALQMRDRLLLFFGEYNILRKKPFADFFIRYNAILDQYKQFLLNKQPFSEDFYKQVHRLALQLRHYHPGMIKSFVWGNRTLVYFLNIMLQTLVSIDPRVKEPDFIDHVVQKVLVSEKSGFTGKIIRNVLGSEVITDMVLKQLKRGVDFLQKQSQEPAAS